MMTKSKKFLLLMLTLIVSVAGYAHTEIDGIKYTLNSSTKEAEVTYGKNSEEVTIPSNVTYDGVKYKVTSIGEKAFMAYDNLVSVKIPNSVTNIGLRAFYGCYNLSYVISDITNPFSLEDKVFGENSSSAILAVPTGTKTLYENAGWSQYFDKVVENGNVEPTKYTMTITTTGNGNTYYNGRTLRDEKYSFTVYDGANATIYITPDDGYRIKTLKVNGTTVNVSNNQYYTVSISRNTIVEVEFEAIPPTTYTLTISATGNGSATYNGTAVRRRITSFTVNEGTNATITFSPDNGCRVKTVKVNNTAVAVSNNQYTVSNISRNTTVEVEFEEIPPTTYTLSITATGNGSASYNGTTVRGRTASFTVNEGTNATITFTPDNGYRVKSVMVNNLTVSVSNNQYTVSNISRNTTVAVEFEAIPPTTYTLTISATGNGSATYNGTTVRRRITTFTMNEGTNGCQWGELSSGFP